MSKRTRKDSTDAGLVDLHASNKIFLPDVAVSYGSYGTSSNENVRNVYGNSVEVESSKEIEHVNVDLDDYEVNDTYYEDVETEIDDTHANENEIEFDEHELYEEPIFDDSIFNDKFLFEEGVLISKDNNSITSLNEINQPLFEGSNYTLKDFCRYMLIIKISQNLGDVSFTIIVGSILAFLPERNALRNYIQENPTMYDINKAITTLSNVTDCCRVFKFKVCDSGTCIKKKIDVDIKQKHCIHPNKTNQNFHYLPIRDRIWKLLHSDVRNLFHSLDYIADLETNDVVCHQ